ncbi:MAG: lipoyl domain-containing protein [Alicyclobacillus macrosporangiidus]|nr:lipoyl domain-containing protein [Alicyclobacillus macrosporangiidus]MCL6597607.1 lipoyl domain-containing protein [Alicyclobacillus macrosporangiidus]
MEREIVLKQRVPVILPQWGSIEEGQVARWCKQVGDWVECGEPIVEIETEKVLNEVNAPVSGVLVEICQPTNTDVRVGSTLGFIEVDCNPAL